MQVLACGIVAGRSGAPAGAEESEGVWTYIRRHDEDTKMPLAASLLRL